VPFQDPRKVVSQAASLEVFQVASGNSHNHNSHNSQHQDGHNSHNSQHQDGLVRAREAREAREDSGVSSRHNPSSLSNLHPRHSRSQLL